MILKRAMLAAPCTSDAPDGSGASGGTTRVWEGITANAWSPPGAFQNGGILPAWGLSPVLADPQQKKIVIILQRLLQRS